MLCSLLISCSKERKSAHDVVVNYYKEDSFNGAVLIAKNGHKIYDTLLGYSDFSRKNYIDEAYSFFYSVTE
ncbi:MAG: hypothetical protein WC756_13265 [Taibaiella sp.]